MANLAAGKAPGEAEGDAGLLVEREGEGGSHRRFLLLAADLGELPALAPTGLGLARGLRAADAGAYGPW